MGNRRAIVCYVDENPHLVQQLLALRLSCLHSALIDTDLVVFGPEKVLVGLPDDLITVPQRPATDDPAWGGYGYVNSIACMNGAGSDILDRYSHVLRTDVDTFMTPRWNDFHPDVLTTGTGGYSNDDNVRARIVECASAFGLSHHGMTNIGSTWYGSTDLVRRASALAEMLCRYLLNGPFRTDPGAWPGWYKGVTLLYAGEIAINHLTPDAERTRLFDAWSTGIASPSDVVHIHCWHTDAPFSKHWFMRRRYPVEMAATLNPNETADYCLALSFQSLIGLENWKAAQRDQKFGASAVALS